MKKVLTLLLVAVVHSLAPAQDAGESEPEKLTALRTSWLNAKEREARPLKDKYLDALQKLRTQLTQRGNLEEAILVRAEIERLTQVAPKDTKPAEEGALQKNSAELQRLRRVFDNEIARLERENDHKYETALDALQKSYERAGKLESALAVKQELKAIRPDDLEPSVEALRIPASAKSWNGHSYRVYEASKIDYAKAKQKCESLGGHLVYLETAEELGFIHGLLKEEELKTAWVGGNDEALEGTFKWMNGTPVSRALPKANMDSNAKGVDYLLVMREGKLQVRAENGHADMPVAWVYGYVCEWDTDKRK